MNEYNHIEYWKAAGKGITDIDGRPKNYELLNHLKTSEFDSVFEIGAGYGRITKLITENFNVKKYTVIDVSKERLDSLANDIKHPNLEIINKPFEEFIPTERYDLVISSEVLMHIPPSLIKEVMAKSCDLSLKHIINVDYWEPKETHVLVSHNFLHQYNEIYRLLGYESKQYIMPNRQCIFHIEKHL